jgi:hypothetical protein
LDIDAYEDGTYHLGGDCNRGDEGNEGKERSDFHDESFVEEFTLADSKVLGKR